MSCVSIKTAPSTRSPIEQSDGVHEASLQGMCPTPELGVNGYDPVNEIARGSMSFRDPSTSFSVIDHLGASEILAQHPLCGSWTEQA